MATSNFAETIAELWRALDLGAPPAADKGEARMRVEGSTVFLRPSPDQSGIRVLAELGDLPEGPDGERVLRSVMSRSLGMLMVNSSCVCMDPGSRMVRIEGHVPFGASVRKMISAIEAVLEAVEILQSEFVGTGSGGFAQNVLTPSPSRRGSDEDDDEIMILRP